VFVLQLDRKRRLTEKDITVISSLLKERVPVRIVAKAFSVSTSTIYRGQEWKRNKVKIY
jgi:IS30 family transposase